MPFRHSDRMPARPLMEPERLPAYDQPTARHIRIEPLSRAAEYLSVPLSGDGTHRTWHLGTVTDSDEIPVG
jgi:hypothetical protein